MFRKSLKKQQKVKALLRHIEPLKDSQSCLLITCGDNNGAMNYRFREAGGHWSWAEFEEKSASEIEALLSEPVHRLQEGHQLPFPDEAFDLIVTIDVHEHLRAPENFTLSLRRALRVGGKVVVTTPDADETRAAVRIKKLVGMKPKDYGHSRWGFTLCELSGMLGSAGFESTSTSTYSRFFTEIVELLINLVYVKLLPKLRSSAENPGSIAPVTQKQFESAKGAMRLYSIAFPVFWLLTKLDFLLLFSRGHAVIVEGRR